MRVHMKFLCIFGQMSVPGLYDESSLFNPVRGRSFDDSEPYILNNKQTGRARAMPENSLLKSVAIDKEKASSVAKIKVVVCFSYFFHLLLPHLFLTLNSTGSCLVKFECSCSNIHEEAVPCYETSNLLVKYGFNYHLSQFLFFIFLFLTFSDAIFIVGAKETTQQKGVSKK